MKEKRFIFVSLALIALGICILYISCYKGIMEEDVRIPAESEQQGDPVCTYKSNGTKGAPNSLSKPMDCTICHPPSCRINRIAIDDIWVKENRKNNEWDARLKIEFSVGPPSSLSIPSDSRVWFRDTSSGEWGSWSYLGPMPIINYTEGTDGNAHFYTTCDGMIIYRYEFKYQIKIPASDWSNTYTILITYPAP